MDAPAFTRPEIDLRDRLAYDFAPGYRDGASTLSWSPEETMVEITRPDGMIGIELQHVIVGGVETLGARVTGNLRRREGAVLAEVRAALRAAGIYC